MRYRLRTLMIATFLAALVCLALRAPTVWWSGGLFSVLLVTMLTAILLAIYRSGQVRAWAIGFLVFSSGYLLVEVRVVPGSGTALSLPTDELIGWSFAKLHPADLQPGAGRQFFIDDPFAPAAPPQKLYAYKGICIATLAGLLGLMGAAIAQLLDRTRKNAVTPEP